MKSTTDDPQALLSAPPKLRRRPFLVVFGVLLIAVGALVAWYVVAIVKDTVLVVAALGDIPRGAVIQRSDLTTVEIRPDPLLATIAADRLDSLVGQRAATDIPAGVIVSPGSVTSALLPEPGQAIVGVALDASQRPATAPRPGQPVTLVSTPRENDDPGVEWDQITFDAVVVGYAVQDSGQAVLDVTVPADQAAAVAALAATGRVAAYWTAEADATAGTGG
jgi:hypothetical protein